jgi:tRNA (guanine37-N1)-methyltransferase
MDAVARFVPGVLGRAEAAERDSFSDGTLDFPHYTRPVEFRGLEVPEVLLSGDHEAVARWRAERGAEATREKRPDLLRSDLTESAPGGRERGAS